jgi:hypothetical protein
VEHIFPLIASFFQVQRTKVPIIAKNRALGESFYSKMYLHNIEMTIFAPNIVRPYCFLQITVMGTWYF